MIVIAAMLGAVAVAVAGTTSAAPDANEFIGWFMDEQPMLCPTGLVEASVDNAILLSEHGGSLANRVDEAPLSHAEAATAAAMTGSLVPVFGFADGVRQEAATELQALTSSALDAVGSQSDASFSFIRGCDSP
jgi:hypothetical protein